MRRSLFLCLLCGLMLVACGEKADVSVVDVRTEMLANPLGIDLQMPRFSWTLACDANDVRQTGYHVIVSSSREKLDNGDGDLWDSGEVVSDQSLYIPYGGTALQSRQVCYWKVKVQTNRGESGWSDAGIWSMGLMQQSDWTAKWIGKGASREDNLKGNTRVPARYLRKSFSVGDNISRATLYISGLGLYEAFIDGQRIGDAQLAPTPTEYDKTVVYNTYDVTANIGAGEHAIGVVLGNGRYTSMRMDGLVNKHYDLPKLLLQLEVEYDDGSVETIVSDGTWKVTSDGPVRSDSEFDGEYYDARKDMAGWNRSGFDDSSWQTAELVQGPAGHIKAQLNPNICIMDTVTPVSVSQLKDGVYILDMGQNMVGWLQLKAKGLQTGDVVNMRFAETLQDDGSIYTANLRTAAATDTYVAGSSADVEWHPSFTYHGFRYVEITGLRDKPSASDFLGLVLYDKMPVLGTFASSNDMLDRIYRNAYWGIRGNYRGMPTDCPQRDERMGWFGDRTTGCIGESYIFGNQYLYAKWLDDIEDAQTEEGSLPDVAPEYWQWTHTDNMTWCGAYLTVAEMLYRQYGDSAPIIKHYPSMKKWMQYMKDKYMVDGIMTKDTYGDWCMPPESPELIHSQDPARITDGGLLSTAFYYYLCGLMSDFATLSGNSSDAAYFDGEAAAAMQAFNNKYFDRGAGYYGNNTVTANILPLRFGMVPDEYRQEVFDNIVRKTVTDFGGHVSTGVIGIQQLMRGLTDYGRGDLALQIATNTTYPSWGYMAENGATTIWELWNGNTADPAMNSGNHVMLLGDLILWKYSYLAGIANHPENAGFKRMLMKPWPVKGLDHVEATYKSPYGLVTSSWKKTDGRFEWQFTIPCNSSAEVQVPCGSDGLDEKERKAIVDLGAKYLKTEEGRAVFDFPSGQYSLSVAYAE